MIVPSAPPPKDKVSYDVARTMIKTGDIISFFESHEETFFHRIVTKSILYFTGSRIYHTGIAIWVNPDGDARPRLMLIEAVGVGRRFVNLSKFSGHKMEVHPIPDYVDRKFVMNYMLDGIGTRYAFGKLARIGLTEFFGARPVGKEGGQVCSEAAAIAWELGGFKFETTSMSPGRLRNYLGAHGAPPTLLINPEAGN